MLPINPKLRKPTVYLSFHLIWCIRTPGFWFSICNFLRIKVKHVGNSIWIGQMLIIMTWQKYQIQKTLEGHQHLIECVSFQNSDPPEAAATRNPLLENTKNPESHKKTITGVIFQKTDLPEAAAPRIPYLERPKTHRCHEHEKEMSFFKILTCRRPMPPKALLEESKKSQKSSRSKKRRHFSKSWPAGGLFPLCPESHTWRVPMGSTSAKDVDIVIFKK